MDSGISTPIDHKEKTEARQSIQNDCKCPNERLEGKSYYWRYGPAVSQAGRARMRDCAVAMGIYVPTHDDRKTNK